MKQPETISLYGVDPGSSKAWAVFKMQCDREGLPVNRPSFDSIPIENLDEFAGHLVSEAKTSPVIIAIDAPICMPQSFSTPGASLSSAYWPFNVNPFSTRPCEKALASKPSVVNASLRFPCIAHFVSEICCWTTAFRDQQNQALTALHKGLSILGYQGAPHGPVVRLFRTCLARQAAESGGVVSYSPNAALSSEQGCIYVLESHPAVTMAIWISQQKLGSLGSLPKYKGDRSVQTNRGLQTTSVSVVALLLQYIDLKDVSISTDDELDALVGLANCFDLVRGCGDWWGTESTGYFLIPAITQENLHCSARQAWDLAQNEVGNGEDEHKNEL